jgi:hypothetical protein
VLDYWQAKRAGRRQRREGANAPLHGLPGMARRWAANSDWNGAGIRPTLDFWATLLGCGFALRHPCRCWCPRPGQASPRNGIHASPAAKYGVILCVSGSSVPFLSCSFLFVGSASRSRTGLSED